MNHKIALGLVGASALFAMGAVDADASGGFFARGRVLSAEPIFQTVSVNHPERHCWNERVEEHHRGGSYAPGSGLAGAIAGGVIGNQVSHGDDRGAATVAGALLGGAIGRGLSYGANYRPDTVSYHVERRCDVVNHYEDHQDVVGYRVKYEYDGKTFWTETQGDPGKWVQVHVAVDAVDDGR